MISPENHHIDFEFRETWIPEKLDIVVAPNIGWVKRKVSGEN